MISIQSNPITLSFDGSLYIPTKLIPTDKDINKFFTTRLKINDFVYYDIDGVMGYRRDNLKFVKNNRVSKNTIVSIVLSNLPNIINQLKNNISYQTDIKYGVELLESGNYNYIKLGIYLLLNGELNNPSMGFVNMKNEKHY